MRSKNSLAKSKRVINCASFVKLNAQILTMSTGREKLKFLYPHLAVVYELLQLNSVVLAASLRDLLLHVANLKIKLIFRKIKIMFLRKFIHFLLYKKLTNFSRIVRLPHIV